MQDLFKYLELYEENCSILINPNPIKMEQDINPIDFRGGSLFSGKLVSSNLVFMNLNSDYIYGEADDNG